MVSPLEAWIIRLLHISVLPTWSLVLPGNHFWKPRKRLSWMGPKLKRVLQGFLMNWLREKDKTRGCFLKMASFTKRLIWNKLTWELELLQGGSLNWCRLNPGLQGSGWEEKTMNTKEWGGIALFWGFQASGCQQQALLPTGSPWIRVLERFQGCLLNPS